MSDTFDQDKMLAKISSIADDLRSRKKPYPKKAVELVAGHLSNTFIAARSATLSKADMQSIRNKLTLHKDTQDHKSIQNFQCYNDFVERLLKSKVAECKFINIALKTDRRLLVGLDKQVLSHVELVLHIRDYLFDMKIPSRETMSNRMKILNKNIAVDKELLGKEIEYTCSYLASVVLFGLTAFPNFHRTLLGLRFRDVSTDPIFIKLPYKLLDVYYRFFLPFPASAYTLRYILFRTGLHRKLHSRKALKPNDFINKDSDIKPQQLAGYFTMWTQSVLRECGVEVNKGLTPPQFYKAALAACLLSPSPNAASAISYPPFILSSQSRKIKNYSFNDIYLYHISRSYQRGIDSEKPKKRVKIINPAITELSKVIDRISIARMSLEKNYHNLGDRKYVSSRILVTIEESKIKLTTHDFKNLYLYGKWIAHMLNDRSNLKITAINDYACMVPSLFYHLAGNKTFHLLSPKVRDDYLRKTMDGYNNNSIRDHLIYYCNFLASELGKKFEKPNWRKKDLRKEKIPSPKSLVSFEDVEEARSRCESHFSRHIAKKTTPSIVEREIDKGAHKAKVFRQIIALAFYTGLRISEITGLRTNHIIFDDGLVLTVRKSKTRNGIRNIPLKLLLPDAVLSEFTDFYREKINRSKYCNSRLFEDLNEHIYSNTTVRKDVQEIFESLGYWQFVFHHLRHSFASWFLMRWFTAFYKNKIPSATPFLKYDLFQPKYLARLRFLLLGADCRNRGQKAFSFVMPALARLMGHGGPIVTLETYVHNPDWIFFLLSKNNEPQTISVTSKQTADFMQVRYPTLPTLFKGRGKKTINIDSLLNGQRNFLGYL